MKPIVCSRCEVMKLSCEFSKAGARKSGVQSSCKACQREMREARIRANPEAERKRWRAWKVNNREAYLQAKREHYHRTKASHIRKGSERRRRRVPALRFELHLWQSYGIDTHDWALMFERQGRRCAACRENLKFDVTTHVDHCHRTGKVRGLLCQGCNLALGAVKESAARLSGLASYLEAHR